MIDSNPQKFDVGCVADLCIDLIMHGNVVPRFHQVEQFVDNYHIELGGSHSHLV